LHEISAPQDARPGLDPPELSVRRPGAEVAGGPRGVVTCPLGHRLHSDLNGALNILRRGAGSIPATLKGPLSFLVDHGGVAPIKGA
jgi:putative transposase